MCARISPKSNRQWLRSRAKLRRIAERRFYNSHNINNNNNSFYYNNNLKNYGGVSMMSLQPHCSALLWYTADSALLYYYLPTTPIIEVSVNNLFYFYGFRVDIGMIYIYILYTIIYYRHTCGETNTPHTSTVNTKTRPLKLPKSKKYSSRVHKSIRVQ